MMPTEIERKFLVADESWRQLYTKSERLRDGLLASSDDCKVRVRMYENRATLTVKSKQNGITRAEFEYEIPAKDAEELISAHCSQHALEKTRYHVTHQGFNWVIDVYEGILTGVILAEVELERAGIDVPMPTWIGREVTDDPNFHKRNLRRIRSAQNSTRQSLRPGLTSAAGAA